MGLPSTAEFIKRQAVVSIGASAVRNQGSKKVVARAREALLQIDLGSFATDDGGVFAIALDQATQTVKTHLPSSAATWGVARKCLNLFLRDCLYNVYLCGELNFLKAEPHFEVPLDGVVAAELKRYYPPRSLPRWLGVKHLTSDDSCVFQDAAQALGDFLDIARVHLDTILWVEGRA